MLVLSRKKGEQIQIGDGIVITVIHLTGKNVKIGIDAPRDTRVTRSELLARGITEAGIPTTNDQPNTPVNTQT